MFRARYIGTIEGVVGRHICGWVVDRKHPKARVAVEVRRADDIRRSVRADIYRADVQKAGHSEDGYCGFCISLVDVERNNPLFVRLSPRHRSVAVQTIRAVPRLEVHRQNGLVYGVMRAGEIVSGFVFDPEDPGARRSVTLIVENGASSAHVACRFDARAKLDPDQDGFNGFFIPYVPKPIRLQDTETGALLASWTR